FSTAAGDPNLSDPGTGTPPTTPIATPNPPTGTAPPAPPIPTPAPTPTPTPVPPPPPDPPQTAIDAIASDPALGVLANGRVLLEVGGKTISKGMTDSNGRYSFTGLTPGRYTVWALYGVTKILVLETTLKGNPPSSDTGRPDPGEHPGQRRRGRV